MKKTALIICAGLMALVSCNKEIASPDQGVKEATPVVFNLTATHPGDTKAVKTGWEDGDVIFVFFSDAASPRHLEMAYDAGMDQWLFTQKNGTVEEAFDLAGGTMTAVYLPFGKNVTVSANYGFFKFSETYLSYYLTDQQEYTVTDGEVSGTLAMKIPEGYVQFFEYVPSSYFDKEMELREPHLTPQGIASISADGTINHTKVVHGAPLPGYVYKKEGTDSDDWGFLFSGILAEEARNTATDYTFTMVYDGWNGSYYTQSFTGKTFYRGEQEGRALRLPDGGWEEITDYKPIDLKTDVYLGDSEYKRVYWSSRNLGASSDFPSDDTNEARQATWGDYYAWGATEPFYTAGHAYDSPCTNWVSGKSGYDWASYPFMREEKADWKFITKYTFADNTTSAIWYDGGTFIGDNGDGMEHWDFASYNYEDDAARQLGSYWHTPSVDEWKALCDDKSNWHTDGTNKGYTVTVEGGAVWTDATIFLPAAGSRANTELDSASSMGFFWASSLKNTSSSSAETMNFVNGGMIGMGCYGRFNGMSIRPVHD